SDWFLTNSAAHGNSRIQYNTNASTHLGAWTLTTLPLPSDEAQRFLQSQPELVDGVKMPAPTECVVNTSQPPSGASTRLYLPVPSHYPDEVRARIWAQGRYRMAPPLVCPQSVIQAYRAPAATAVPNP